MGGGYRNMSRQVCVPVCVGGEGGVGWLRVGWALGTDAWPVLGLPPILVHVLAESAPGSICGRPSTHAFPRPLPHPPLPSHALPLSLSSDAEGQREYQLHEDCIPSVLKPGWLHFKRWASLQTQSANPAPQNSTPSPFHLICLTLGRSGPAAMHAVFCHSS